MTTPYWSDFIPNSTFYRILSGIHTTFATGVACRQGTLTPPDTWSRPFGTCICSTCWDQSFSELVVTLLDYALRISLGTFSSLLLRVNFVIWNTILAVYDAIYGKGVIKIRLPENINKCQNFLLSRFMQLNPTNVSIKSGFSGNMVIYESEDKMCCISKLDRDFWPVRLG